jgi:hypothetical protein
MTALKPAPDLKLEVPMQRDLALWNAICLGADAAGVSREEYALRVFYWWQDQGMPYLVPGRGGR